MRRFETRRPSKIKLSEDTLIPTLQKLAILQERYSDLQNLLKACETEKSSLKFEIAKLNKKVTRLGSEKADINSELMKTIYSGKKKQAKKRTRKAGGTISPLTYSARKVKLKEYITKIVRDNLDDNRVLELVSNLKLHNKDYGIIILGVLEYLKDRRNRENISINDDYIKEKLEQAKNIQEEGTRNLVGKNLKKKSKKKI